MSDVTRVSVEIGGTEISFETGKMAKQASGAVTVQARAPRLLPALSVRARRGTRCPSTAVV